MRLRLTALGLALALTSGVAPAEAGFNATVTGSTTALANGFTVYSYTITDLPTSTVNVGEFTLTVPTNANLVSFSQPSGYIVDYTPGNTSIAFESTSPATDLMPGGFETFSFASLDKPGTAGFTLLDYNTFSTVSGSVVAPSAVPEPGSLILLGLGMACAVAVLARRPSRGLVALTVLAN